MKASDWTVELDMARTSGVATRWVKVAWHGRAGTALRHAERLAAARRGLKWRYRGVRLAERGAVLAQWRDGKAVPVPDAPPPRPPRAKRVHVPHSALCLRCPRAAVPGSRLCAACAAEAGREVLAAQEAEAQRLAGRLAGLRASGTHEPPARRRVVAEGREFEVVWDGEGPLPGCRA